jgi:hypothetical protein
VRPSHRDSVNLHAMERQTGLASPEGAVRVESSACAPGTKVPRAAVDRAQEVSDLIAAKSVDGLSSR